MSAIELNDVDLSSGYNEVLLPKINPSVDRFCSLKTHFECCLSCPLSLQCSLFQVLFLGFRYHTTCPCNHLLFPVSKLTD